MMKRGPFHVAMHAQGVRLTVVGERIGEQLPGRAAPKCPISETELGNNTGDVSSCIDQPNAIGVSGSTT
jgi:hypothetical protein